MGRLGRSAGGRHRSCERATINSTSRYSRLPSYTPCNHVSLTKMVFQSHGPVSFTKTTLSYPVYAAEFDPYNRGFLVAGGGGGQGRSGVANKIVSYVWSLCSRTTDVDMLIDAAGHEQTLGSGHDCRNRPLERRRLHHITGYSGFQGWSHHASWHQFLRVGSEGWQERTSAYIRHQIPEEEAGFGREARQRSSRWFHFIRWQGIALPTSNGPQARDISACAAPLAHLQA